MKTIAKTFCAAAAALTILAPAAFADQYIVSLDTQMGDPSPQLLEILRVQIVDRFSHDGGEFVIIDARNEAYLEALFHATSVEPRELWLLPVAWDSSAMADLDTVARMRFAAPVACVFCS
ncbi:hypothetical protein HKCCE3408_06980 [Rhodobacterales bacterium HKCCE3408]|nr:hypothetical protein [Rhodobacterales bacterium HKCCE3408]